MQETKETQVRSLGWEDPLEEKMATHSSILGVPLWLSWGDLGLIPVLGRSPGEWKVYPLQYAGLENGVAKSRTPLSDFHFQ